MLKRELKAGKGIGPELKEFLLSHANISAEALDDLLRGGPSALKEALDQS